MEALHQLIHQRKWDLVQHSIQLDASVAMRIDDSIQEDLWVDEARRLWIFDRQNNNNNETTTTMAEEESNHLLFLEAHMKIKNQCKTTGEDNGNPLPAMQLRYWVGNNNGSNDRNNNTNSEAHKLRRMTLLHSLCRLDFSSRDVIEHETETNEDNNGSGDGLQQNDEDDDLIMAIQTAEMIISASHNEQHPCCPFHYCPPMFFPAVSKGDNDDEGEDTGREEDVMHTSALTVPDKMGGTPLHQLTSSGSHHAELIKALFRGCAPLNRNHGDRRPTAYDLLTAPNDHGSTPLHFISECNRNQDEGVLRFVLEQCPLSLDSEERVHPSMVADNEGDLPLHYALSNNASPECLALLTTLGDKRAALTPNSQHRLPVDVLIEWYNDNLEDFFEKQNAGSDQSEEEEEEEEEEDSDDDETSGSSESELSEASTHDSDKHQEEVATANVDADESRPAKDIVSAWDFLKCNNLCHSFFPLDVPGKCYLCPGKSVGLVIQGLFSEGSNSRDFWESDLWKQMIVLVNAAAVAIVGANRIDKTEDAESYLSILRSNPVHAAVIATKYGNFPAFALAMASPLDKNLRNEMAATYFLGYLPIHWACGDVSFLLNSTYSYPTTKYQDQKNPSTVKYSELVRFNTYDLGITVIQYLLLLFPEAARIPTEEHGELPLHLFLQDRRALWNYLSKKSLGRARGDSPDTPRQTPWDEIKSLLTACPEALSTPSLTHHLYPFQLAATCGEEDVDVEMHRRTRLCSLENTYRLILEDPSIVYRNA
jgi:hypothetical protein